MTRVLSIVLSFETCVQAYRGMADARALHLGTFLTSPNPSVHPMFDRGRTLQGTSIVQIILGFPGPHSVRREP